MFIGLITLTINFKAYAGDVWKFEWSNTKIEIPLGSNANLYKDKPQARLIKNNKIMKDATISIDSNGDWMYYFRNINTNKCGSYYVWYKAFESKYRPGTCTNYKCLVQFQVVDKEAPVISFLSDNVTLKRGTNINLLDNVNYSDNSNCECELKILSDIDYTKIGTYDVIVSCKDVNNNISKKSFKLTIYDDAKPKIYCKNNGSIITIPYKGEYDLSKYFEALDPFDGDISNKIQYPLFSNDKIGKFEYTVSVENSNYKTDSLTVLIEVIDEIEPVLTVKNKNIIIDYDIDLDNYDFISNIDIIINNNILIFDC